MQTTVPPNWKPAEADRRAPRWKPGKEPRPLVRLKPAHLRPHPVACSICGEPAGNFMLDDPTADYATCYACNVKARLRSYAFRRGYGPLSYTLPADLWPPFRACLVALAHLEMPT